MGKIKYILGSCGNGKTEKAIECVLEEVKRGKNCIFFTTEDYNDVLFKRCISKLSDNNGNPIEKIDTILSNITFSKLHYSSNVSNINAIIAAFEKKFDIICIDTANDLFSNFKLSVNNVVFSELKHMADIFNCDVILTVQLNHDGNIPLYLRDRNFM